MLCTDSVLCPTADLCYALGWPITVTPVPSIWPLSPRVRIMPFPPGSSPIAGHPVPFSHPLHPDHPSASWPISQSCPIASHPAPFPQHPHLIPSPSILPHLLSCFIAGHPAPSCSILPCPLLSHPIFQYPAPFPSIPPYSTLLLSSPHVSASCLASCFPASQHPLVLPVPLLCVLGCSACPCLPYLSVSWLSTKSHSCPCPSLAYLLPPSPTDHHISLSILQHPHCSKPPPCFTLLPSLSHQNVLTCGRE